MLEIILLEALHIGKMEKIIYVSYNILFLFPSMIIMILHKANSYEFDPSAVVP
jgi:hypothetical protein